MNGFLTDNGYYLTMEHWSKHSVMRHTHIHPQYELYFCPQKVAQYSVINGVSYTYTYPCVILSAPFTVHSMSCDDPDADRYERYVFYFGDSFLKTLSAHLPEALSLTADTGLMFALTEAQAAYLKRIIDLCEPNTSLAQRELTFALFLNKLVEFCPMENVVRGGAVSFYLRDVLRYIAENFSSVSNSDEVARRFSVSRSKLDRDFKRFTGLSVHGFINTCRVNQAKYLLQFSRETSIGAIAECCGFEGETYFFPFFKKHTGMTPVEFRKRSEWRDPTIQEGSLSRSICGKE